MNHCHKSLHENFWLKIDCVSKKRYDIAKHYIGISISIKIFLYPLEVAALVEVMPKHQGSLADDQIDVFAAKKHL